MSEALVIIDMQPGFCTALDGTTQDNIVSEIKKAIANDEWIFVLEYYNYGATVKKIRHAYHGYKKVAYVTKYEDDGSYPLMNCIENIIPDEQPDLKLTGINFGACVKSTAIGLVDNGYPSNKIVVIGSACNQPTEWEDMDGYGFGCYDDNNENNDDPFYEDYSWSGVTMKLNANNICVV